MTTIVGADGCAEGWLCVFEELPSRQLGSKVFRTIGELFAAAPEVRVLAIDVPIGLTDAGARLCDVAARKRLGPVRGTSVFPAPIRPALYASDYLEACEISLRAQKKKISKQGWAIYPKIREVDEFLRANPRLQERIFEVHLEVTFAQWNGGAIVESKKSDEGFATRLSLVEQHFGDQAFERVRARYRRRHAQDDDIVDAFAALWTAERIFGGHGETLPAEPPLDSAGLPMRIVF